MSLASLERVCRPAVPPTLGISLLLPQGSCPAARDKNSDNTKYIDLCIAIYLFHDVYVNSKLYRVVLLVADPLPDISTTDTDIYLCSGTDHKMVYLVFGHLDKLRMIKAQ